MWWVYLDQNNSRHKVCKMKIFNIFQFSEVMHDFFYEISSEKWKWYAKKYSITFFENCYYFLSTLVLKKSMLLSHENFIIGYFIERNMSNE